MTDYYDDAEDQEEQDLKFKVLCRESIDRFGGMERVENLLNSSLPDEIVEPLRGEAITAQKLQEYKYGYLLMGLDNPLGLTFEGLKNGIVELEKLKTKGLSAELAELFKFARASLGFKLKDGREYSYDIHDLRYMLQNERKKLKNSKRDCNTTVKPLP